MKFDNMGDGVHKDNEIEFKHGGSFIIGYEKGTWKALDAVTLITTLRGEEETYKFNNNGTEAVCVKPLTDPPAKIVIHKRAKRPNAEEEAEEYNNPEAIDLLKEKYFSFWEGPKEDVDLRYEQFRSQN